MDHDPVRTGAVGCHGVDAVGSRGVDAVGSRGVDAVECHGVRRSGEKPSLLYLDSCHSRLSTAWDRMPGSGPRC